MSKRFLFTVITVLVIGLFGGLAIFFAKGYTISSKEGKIVSTGIINVSSVPDAASVFVDGHLTTSTNATIQSLKPKKYTVRIVKEGFIPWEKEINVKAGLVSEVKVTLFPAIPTTYPLTFTGVRNAVLSPDGSKLAYTVSVKDAVGVRAKKNGIWVWTMVRNQPIAFARSSEPHQIASSLTADFSEAVLRWSSDSKHILATRGNNNYLLDSDVMNDEPRDITPTLEATLREWEESEQESKRAIVASIKDLNLSKIASESAYVSWAPDETKFIARKEAISPEEKNKLVNGLKLYDLVEKKEYDLPQAKAIFWLPDSEHLVMVEEGLISILDYDGSNKASVYAGNFEDSLVFPWPDSSRLVFISSFPTPTASEPNLYGVNLR